MAMVAFGQRVDVMILEVFAKPVNSMTLKPRLLFKPKQDNKEKKSLKSSCCSS